MLSEPELAVDAEKKAAAQKARRSRRAARALRVGTVLQILSRGLSHHRFAGAASEVVNHLAKALECERVTLGMQGVRRLQVCAISGTVDLEPRQLAVRSLSAAMQEAVDARSTIVYPMPRKAAQAANSMHAALIRQGTGSAVYSIPLLLRGQIAGVLTFENNAGFDERFIESAKDIACFVGPVLATQFRADKSITGALLRRRERRAKSGSRWPVNGKELALLATGVLIAVVAAFPINLTVSSPATVQGEGQRVISAPVDGFIKSVAQRPGDPVNRNELLVTLDDEDLVRTVEKWRVEASQLDREYRDALSQDDAAEIVVARARLSQATVQLEQAETDLTRTRLRAPIGGIVVSGDLQDSIGMPVKRGQELLTIAPQSAYRIVAAVDEQDIGFISAGQKAQVVFAAISSEAVPIVIDRISPVARTKDGRNVFEIDGLLQADGVALYHGLSGIARIDVDQRPVASVFWLRLSQRLRKLFWRLVG
ncbi:MAG: efflux RND transporter periplasmic adaptor subunit [Burkholderiaceae bacterium]